MQLGPPRRRRARPVADAPVDALLLGVEDLAKGWLLAMLEQASLEEAPSILAVDLARDGPRICDAVVRALADETDLRRLEPGGALERLISRAGGYGGNTGLESTSRAIDALQGVIWTALRAELSAPDADQVSELAERLALVIEQVRLAAFRRLESGEQEPVRPRFGGIRVVPADQEGADVSASAGEVGEGGEGAEGEPAAPSGDAPSAGAPAAPPMDAPSAGAPAAPPIGTPSTPLAGSRAAAPDALWVGAVEDEIMRSERSSSPLSLLLAELEDADKVSAVEEQTEATATFGRFAQALRGVARRQDILACETESRAWIISRDTGRLGAQALADRIVAAVRTAPPWRGAPMAVSVGVAVFGEDGRDAASLIAAAEEARFAAAASGVGTMQEARDPEDRPGA